MANNVTAILVVKDGGARLKDTLDALQNQTSAPARLIVVALGETPAVTEELNGRGINHVVVAKPKVSFGDAISFAVQATEPLTTGVPEGEWLWFLAEDSSPAPDALQKLVHAVARAGTVAVAGPKIVSWDDPGQIIELGQGLTWSGARWGLDNQELDQQQYDGQEDVLGVGPVGMFVRRAVWQKLEGFDSALPVYDDGLDFCVRARLAGYRVVVEPQARVRFARTGIAGPKINRKHAVLRRAHRQARQATLHRKLSYARPFFVPLLWILLPLIGFLGAVWAVVRGRPGTILGEIVAALQVFLRPGRVVRARRVIRNNNVAKWGAIKPLRTDLKTVRSVRAVRKEMILAEQGRSRKDLNFIASGGLGLTVTLAVFGVSLTWWLLGASFVNGGGMAPLSNVAGLWQNTFGSYPEELRGLQSFAEAAPADPMNWVLAVFGSLTFWNPSLATVLLLIFAVPGAGLGGWMWAASLTESRSARVVSGVLWGAGPMLLAALGAGRINSVILSVTLPWVLLAIKNAHVTWSWTATASLLVAVALAAAPILLPAAVLMLIAGLLLKPKKIAQTLFIAVAPAVLFVPLLLRAWRLGTPLDALIDPGIATPYVPATPWQMLLGFPTFGLDGHGEILRSIGLSGPSVTLTVGFLLIPLAFLAVFGLFMGHPRLTALTALAGALGLVTALISPFFQLTPRADELIAVWAGSGLALYWAAVLTLATLGLTKLAKGAAPVAILTIIGVLLIVSPTLFKLVTNNVAVKADETQLPAVALAQAQNDAQVRTLFITALDEGRLRTEIIEGQARTIDQMHTANVTAPPSDIEIAVAEIIAELASPAGSDVSDSLSDARIGAIVLRPAATGGLGLHAALQTAFDQQAELAAVGETSKGLLWRVVAGSAEPSVTSAAVTNADTIADQRPSIVWGIQLGVLAGVILLALPTSEVRMRPPKQRRSQNKPVQKKPVQVNHEK